MDAEEAPPRMASVLATRSLGTTAARVAHAERERDEARRERDQIVDTLAGALGPALGPGAALTTAAGQGDAYCVKALLAMGAAVDTQDRHGRTALMAAAMFRRVPCVETLLAKNSALNTADHRGNTALHYAVRSGHDSADVVVEMLLEAGADTRMVNGDGKTALQIAEEHGLALLRAIDTLGG